MMTRRDLLRNALVGGLVLGLPVPLFAATDKKMTESRCLSLCNLHTGERLRDVAYWAEGRYQADALDALNHLLRDHRNGEVTRMDPQLFDLVYLTQNSLGMCAEVQVVSGYRSPATNELLRRQGHGVARNSMHARGRALDIRLPGCDLKTLHRSAVELRAGGVGYYPKSNFVHIDTGRYRLWQGV
ncbi:MAG: DUF882 domain-containing protein [Geothermobacteraceae bacterium]